MHFLSLKIQTFVNNLYKSKYWLIIFDKNSFQKVSGIYSF